MTNLTRKKPRKFRRGEPASSLPCPSSASTTLYQGAAVELSSGLLQNATGAGTTFAGFLDENATGDGTSDGTNVAKVVRKGEVLLTCAHATTFALSDEGAAVYLTDGDTFTTVSTSAQQIGKISEIPPAAVGAASAQVWVTFEGKAERSI